MSLSWSYDLDHKFCMPFINRSFFTKTIILFVFDFSRYYFNLSIIFSHIQMNFIFQNIKYLFLNNIFDMFGFVS